MKIYLAKKHSHPLKKTIQAVWTSLRTGCIALSVITAIAAVVYFLKIVCVFIRMAIQAIG